MQAVRQFGNEIGVRTTVDDAVDVVKADHHIYGTIRSDRGPKRTSIIDDAVKTLPGGLQDGQFVLCVNILNNLNNLNMN